MRLPMFIAPLLPLLILAGCTAIAAPQATATALPDPAAPPQIIVDATVRPRQQSELRFETSGSVAEVLVQEGDIVTVGDPLARLDPRDLQLAVDQAQAALGEAQAAYAQLEAGSTPAEIAAAQARRDQAAAQLTQTQGGVTAGDRAAAQASLRAAQENLAKLRRGADPESIAAAQAQVAQAQSSLASQRDALSSAKTQAESQQVQAANTLRTLQDDYSRIYWDNREREGQPGDLDQHYIDQEAAALRQVQNAEEALRQTQTALEQARQAEVTGIQTAQARRDEAQANLESLLAPADPDQIAAAEAQVAQARATLEQLRGPARTGQVAAAEAQVAQAQANLDQAAAPTRAVDLDVALAQIQSAEVSLRQAERNREKATLRAPFAGEVGEVNLDVGAAVSSAGAAAVIIADTSAWKIETDNLNERDVVQLAVGHRATLTFDALPNLRLIGTIQRIQPIGKDTFGDTTYVVSIIPNDPNTHLRWNMSATVTFDVPS